MASSWPYRRRPGRRAGRSELPGRSRLGRVGRGAAPAPRRRGGRDCPAGKPGSSQSQTKPLRPLQGLRRAPPSGKRSDLGGWPLVTEAGEVRRRRPGLALTRALVLTTSGVTGVQTRSSRFPSHSLRPALWGRQPRPWAGPRAKLRASQQGRGHPNLSLAATAGLLLPRLRAGPGTGFGKKPAPLSVCSLPLGPPSLSSPLSARELRRKGGQEGEVLEGVVQAMPSTWRAPGWLLLGHR